MTGFEALFLSLSLTYGLPDGVLSAVCFVETGHRADIVTLHDGNGPSYGLCQIKLPTARLMGFKGKAKDLLNARVNATFAAKYLRYQLTRYRGDVSKAVTAYNKGSSTSHGGSAYLAKVFNRLHSER